VEVGAPIDAFGVGSDLGVAADAPVIDTVYKLVEFDGRAVRKLSPGKATWPGCKQVWRSDDWSGDVLGLVSEGAGGMLVDVMVDGARVPAGRHTLTEAQAQFDSQWAALPEGVKALRGFAPYPVEPSDPLLKLTEEVDNNIV
jgi:nicotinate phosphoribosyltransferase